MIENRVGWLKEARVIATRFEKLAIHSLYLGLLELGMIRLLPRRLPPPLPDGAAMPPSAKSTLLEMTGGCGTVSCTAGRTSLSRLGRSRTTQGAPSSPAPTTGPLVKLLAKLAVACVLTVACRTSAAVRAAGPAGAPAVERVENYTTQSLLVYNARGEVALQRNFMGWSTPGVRFDRRESIRASLDGLAAKYGMTITDVRLAGLFTYEYGFGTAIATRSHYAATLAGGALAAPGDMLEVRWVSPPEAVRLISSATQKSPPSFVAMTTQMLTRPDRIWGGAFHVWQEGETYRSRVTEPIYELGRPR